MISSPPQIRLQRRSRRSKRLKLSVNVLVHGKGTSGESFRELTRTLSVSAHGGLLELVATVQKEQTIQLENRHTRKQQECRVVYVGPAQNGRWPVGIEFAGDATDFWGVYFPPLSSN